MKPFSPLKPLIAAMFVLAAASASAASTVTVNSADDTSYAFFGQSFSVTAPSYLSSWTFFGVNTPSAQAPVDVSFNFGVFDSPDLLNASIVGEQFTGAYTAGIDGASGSWTFSVDSAALESNVTYYAVMSYSGHYGTVSLVDNPLSGPAFSSTDVLSPNQEVSGYKYDASFSPVTAVPEPESYAMMLAGLGLMGAIARRRSRKA